MGLDTKVGRNGKSEFPSFAANQPDLVARLQKIRDGSGTKLETLGCHRIFGSNSFFRGTIKSDSSFEPSNFAG